MKIGAQASAKADEGSKSKPADKLRKTDKLNKVDQMSIFLPIRLLEKQCEKKSGGKGKGKRSFSEDTN